MTLRYLREPGTVIGTAAEFTARNLVLLNRQLGTETDTGKSKLGDATTAWNSLAYLPGGGGGIADVTTPTRGIFFANTPGYQLWTGDPMPLTDFNGGDIVQFSRAFPFDGLAWNDDGASVDLPGIAANEFVDLGEGVIDYLQPGTYWLSIEIEFDAPLTAKAEIRQFDPANTRGWLYIPAGFDEFHWQGLVAPLPGNPGQTQLVIDVDASDTSKSLSNATLSVYPVLA